MITDAHTLIRSHSCALTMPINNAHARTHARTHAHTHIYTHTHTCTHARPRRTSKERKSNMAASMPQDTYIYIYVKVLWMFLLNFRADCYLTLLYVGVLTLARGFGMENSVLLFSRSRSLGSSPPKWPFDQHFLTYNTFLSCSSLQSSDPQEMSVAVLSVCSWITYLLKCCRL